MRAARLLDGSLTAFLEIMAENFRANDNLLALINNISGGNTRLALQAVADFLRSGYVDVPKMIEIYRMSGSYAISVDEFLPTLLLGADFLLSILLTHAQLAGKGLREEGCVAADYLYTVAHEHGFTVDQVRSALDYAESYHLLDAVLRPHQDQRRLCFRITAMGTYRARVLQAYCGPDRPVTPSPVPSLAKRTDGANK